MTLDCGPLRLDKKIGLPSVTRNAPWLPAAQIPSATRMRSWAAAAAVASWMFVAAVAQVA